MGRTSSTSSLELPIWTDAMVRFMPRSLNLGSHGKWVTCKFSGLPDDYASRADVNLESLCIVSVNGEYTRQTLSDGLQTVPFNNRNKRKLMVNSIVRH